MNVKLSEYEVIPGFNRVASALFKENGINPSEFDKLFPDQVLNLVNFDDFFNSIPILKNTDKFIEKIKNFDRFSPICIYGDYDCDGIMGTTIMYHSLCRLGYNVHFYIPDRLRDGYGMQEQSIKEDIEKYGTKLIITVDNGIASKDLVEVAKSCGTEVIITDHHLPDGTSAPDTLVIDPKYNGDEFSDICGAYVALKLCHALYSEIDPTRKYIVETLLPFAGIATITDMMPMLCENRQLVKITLDIINNVKYDYKSSLYKILYSLGGQNFMKKRSMIATEELISFGIGPAINAISRVRGDVSEPVKKILECLERPWIFMESYSKINFTRQQMTNELFGKFQYDENYKNSSIYVYNKEDFDYNFKGILGLIANKISNKYKIVSLVGSEKDNNTIEFSGRSVPSYNLHEGIERIKTAHPELGLGGGGHAQAMGIRVNKTHLDEFRRLLEEDIQNTSESYNPTVFEWEDEMEEEIISTMEELQPYGAGFNKLKFKYSGPFIEYDEELKLATIGKHKFRMFVAAEEINYLLGTDLDVLFTISYADSTGPIFNIIKE